MVDRAVATTAEGLIVTEGVNRGGVGEAVTQLSSHKDRPQLQESSNWKKRCTEHRPVMLLLLTDHQIFEILNIVLRTCVEVYLP